MNLLIAITAFTFLNVGAIVIIGSLFWAVMNFFVFLRSPDKKARRTYRRRAHPKNIEKSTIDLLELELQEFLREEEVKEKARSREQHPTAYLRKLGGSLDKETQEILSRVTSERQGPRRRSRGRQFWWGE